MNSLTRFTPAVLLGAGCLLTSGLREQEKVPSRKPMSALSIGVPGRTVIGDIVVAEEERKVAGMTDYVFKTFQRDTLDAGLSVYVGYYDYQVQGKTIHSPKNCLPGAGWEQVSAEVRQIPVGGTTRPINRYLLAAKGQQALVYYWYQGRGRVEANEYRVKWNLMRDAAVYGRTDEALVRIVVPVPASELRSRGPATVYAEADRAALTLAKELIPSVEQLLPTPPGNRASQVVTAPAAGQTIAARTP
jgi:EpsI family protein